MEMDEKAEEILETLWIRTQEEKEGSVPLAVLTEVKGPIEQLFMWDILYFLIARCA